MSRAAVRYAKAILEISNSGQKAELVNQDMKTIAQSITESQELKDFLANPVVKSEVKANAISEIFGDVQNETKGLFELLKANKRFAILEAIASQYSVLFDQLMGVEKAIVTTAFPITSELETQVLNKVKEFSKNKITLTNIVDESIIGGFILRVGDKQFNASVASKLQQLKREFSY